MALVIAKLFCERCGCKAGPLTRGRICPKGNGSVQPHCWIYRKEHEQDED